MRKKIKARRHRPRERSGVRAELTLDEWFDLQLAASDQFANDAERRANYDRHRDRLLARTNLTQRPEAVWDYEPDVPDACRRDVLETLAEQYDPVLHETEDDRRLREVSGPHIDPDGELARSGWAYQELQRRREAWLLGAGRH